MDDISTIHGKLLFVIYELYQSKIINERDKNFLKGTAPFMKTWSLTKSPNYGTLLEVTTIVALYSLLETKSYSL